MATTIPTPGLLGLPEAFPTWRRHQDSAIFQIRDCPKKYLGILAPTGFGKSAMAIGHALWSGDRVLILTANKGLQDQYLSDFAGIVQDIRGQANYDCHKALVTVAEAPCHAGFRCDLKQEGCDHFDLKRAAGDPATRIVLSNYQFLFHSMREREGLGHFDLVVCDEAHNILSELSKFLAITITGSETRQFLKSEPPSEWTSWSAHHLGNITQELEHLRKSKSQDPAHFRLVHQYKSLKRRLTTLARATPQGWMMTPGRFRGEFAWNCIWPGMYAKHYLFKRADRFLLTSASIRPEVFRSLHIAPEKFHFIEYPSSIPVARRPVYYYPCIRYTADSDIHEITYLLSIVQQIIERRLDRKGIIHSVSYERAELFVRELEPKLGKIFITHRSSAELPAAIAAFRAAKAPCVFVSPAISEGFNFPYSDAEYAILPKVPFPDHRSPIHQARSRGNKTYGMLEVCISIRQSLGRHVRADNDQGESFILDESFSWLLRSYRRFFPRDFLESIKEIRYLTPPPPPLVVPKNISK